MKGQKGSAFLLLSDKHRLAYKKFAIWVAKKLINTIKIAFLHDDFENLDAQNAEKKSRDLLYNFLKNAI